MKSAAIIYALLWATNDPVPAGVQIVSIARPQAWAVEVEAVEPPAAEPQPWPTYPLRSNNWTYPGNIRNHFLGTHADPFDREWLAAQSDASLIALHSDVHQGRVKWEFTVRAKPTAKMPVVKGPQNCPSGNCPVNRGPALLFPRLRF